jgi:hypothetical protein
MDPDEQQRARRANAAHQQAHRAEMNPDERRATERDTRARSRERSREAPGRGPTTAVVDDI